VIVSGFCEFKKAVIIGLLEAQGGQVELVKNSTSIILSPEIPLFAIKKAKIKIESVKYFFIAQYLIALN